MLPRIRKPMRPSTKRPVRRGRPEVSKKEVIVEIRGIKRSPEMEITLHNPADTNKVWTDDAVIDTGAESSSIGIKVAKRLGLKKIGSVRIIGVDGKVVVRNTFQVLVVVQDKNGKNVVKVLSVSEKQVEQTLLGMDWIGTVKPTFVYK